MPSNKPRPAVLVSRHLAEIAADVLAIEGFVREAAELDAVLKSREENLQDRLNEVAALARRREDTAAIALADRDLAERRAKRYQAVLLAVADACYKARDASSPESDVLTRLGDMARNGAIGGYVDE
jgi:hypothetical protein